MDSCEFFYTCDRTYKPESKVKSLRRSLPNLRKMALKNKARISLLLLSFNLLLFLWIRSISSEGKFMLFKMTSVVSTSCEII